MARITEPSTIERTVAVVCDRCQTRIEVGTPAFDAVTHINHRCGYNSAWEDGAQITADICEECLHELICDFVKPVPADDPLPRLAGSVTEYLAPTEPATPASNWESYADTEKASADFMADRDANSGAINLEAVFRLLEEMRKTGELARRVTTSLFRYQASATHPGLLERIDADGTITVGHFENGEFKPIEV